MIIAFLFNLIVLVVGAVFSLLPTVDTLPTIFGFNIDAALVSGVGALNTFTNTFWPIRDLLGGFFFLMGYYAFKIGLRFLLGHRAPGGH